MKVAGWGNYPIIDSKLYLARDNRSLASILNKEEHLIARGLGRSYGDSSLSQTVVSFTNNNRILSFNQKSGVLNVESGISLSEILDILVPHGWFLPTTPGTKFITIGGAIACDVHGKNHHTCGTFGEQVIEMDIMLPNGSVVNCSNKKNSDLFFATIGGMGLTGFILRASFTMIRIDTAYIKSRSIKAANLDAIMDLFEEYENWTYSVAWIDCISKGTKLGRSILNVGEHAGIHDLSGTPFVKKPLNLKEGLKLTVPFKFPSIALNPLSVRAFNIAYYNKQVKDKVNALVPYNSFFYPLDSIHQWNNIYGRRGFTQYQFVLPKQVGREGFREVLTRIAKSGQGSFLAVLKLCGRENNNFLSFPLEGYSLALDFPITRALFPLLDELDLIVHDAGGRVYLTKDVRLHPGNFERGYRKGIKKFLKVRKMVDPHKKMSSLQSKRLGL